MTTHSKFFEQRTIVSVVLSTILFLISTLSVSASAYDFSYSGRLVDKDGKPLAGPVALKISFFHSETTTTSILDVTTGIENVLLKDGVFQVVLSLDGSDFQRVFPTVSQSVYIEVTDLTNASGTPYGRQRLTILPYAGKVPVDTSQFAWSSDGRLQLAVSGGSDSTAVATLSNKTIDATTNTITNISNASISPTAAIADSKLATISTAGKVSGAAITSGTIAGTTAVSTSGSIATTGKMGVGAAAGTSQMEVKGGGATSATSSLNVMDSGGSSKLFVRDDGNVGVGTATPAMKLDVNGAIASRGSLYVGANADFKLLAEAWTIQRGVSSKMLFGAAGESKFDFDTVTSVSTDPIFSIREAGISRFTVGDTGNVGIGTTSPGAVLHLAGTAFTGGNAGQLIVQDTSGVGGASSHYIPFNDSAGTNVAYLYKEGVSGNFDIGLAGTTGTSNKFRFVTGGTTRLAIQSDGNVGIGTTSPSAKLEVVGQIVSRMPAVMAPTGTTQTVDFGGGNIQTLDLSSASGNVTITFSNPVAGGSYAIKFVQGSTPRTVSWPAGVKWPNGSPITLSTSNGAIDLVTLFYDGTNYFAVGGNNFQ